MAENPILVPKMGESISEATVIRWLKNVGERVEKDEPIVEIATDKVDNEIPSPSEGVLTQQLFQDGDVVKVGEAIAMIDGNGEAVAEASKTPESKEPTTQSPVEEIENQISEAAELAKPVANNIVSKPENSNRFYSPLVMSIASQEGIPSNELETITGTGLEGRVTKADILKYIKNRGNAPSMLSIRVTKKMFLNFFIIYFLG